MYIWEVLEAEETRRSATCLVEGYGFGAVKVGCTRSARLSDQTLELVNDNCMGGVGIDICLNLIIL